MIKIRNKLSLLWCTIAILSLAGCNLTDLIFNPYKQYGPFPDSKKYNYEIVQFESKNGKQLEGWFFKPTIQNAKGTVLHLHGNSRNISYQFHKAIIWVDQGYQLLTFDYQGYGKSEGHLHNKTYLKMLFQH